MSSKKYILKFRETNRDIFDTIKKGKKKVETRAGSPRYFNVKTGDTLVFVCGKDRFETQVKRVKKFKDVKLLLKAYKPQEINPKTGNLEESEKMYYSFPGYREKIKRYGLVAIEL